MYRFLSGVTSHPNADEVFQEVRSQVPGISLATVYKSLETLVNCGLAAKLTYSDGSARYDARRWIPITMPDASPAVGSSTYPGTFDRRGARGLLSEELDGFSVLGYRLELTGFCGGCSPHQGDEESEPGP